MSAEEERLMSLMPQACGQPLVEKLTIGSESAGNKATLRAKLCCAGCASKGWTAVVRTSKELATLDLLAQSFARKIEDEHVDHHRAAISEAYDKVTGVVL